MDPRIRANRAAMIGEFTLDPFYSRSIFPGLNMKTALNLKPMT